MKKMIAFAILLIAAFAVQAEDCKPPAAKYVHTGNVGANLFIYWWCSDTQFAWAYLIPADATAALLKTNATFWLGFDHGPANPPRAVDDPLVLELWAAAWHAMQADTDRPPRVAAPVETVAKNGSYTSRPAYPVVNGEVGTKEEARAVIGLPCDCNARKLMKGSSMYCAAPPPNASLVTLCRVP